MTQKIFLYILAFTLIACNNDEGESDIPTIETTVPQPVNDPLFTESAFLKYLSANDTAFSLSDFVVEGSTTLPKEESSMADEQLTQYKQLFIYNADSTQAVDLFSYGTMLEGTKVYGGEPDSEAALIDVKTKARKRLLFIGPSYGFADAVISNNTIVIMGYENVDQKIKPIAWFIDLKNSTVQTLVYKNSLEISVPTFLQKRFPGYSF